MPTIISNTSADYILADAESLVLLASGSLVSYAGPALSSLFGNNNVKIAGTITGDVGIQMTGPTLTFSTILLSQTATIFAVNSGIALGNATSEINNAGSIFSEGAGIQVLGIAEGSTTRIVNTGLISGHNGIVISPNETAPFSDVTFVNRGTVMAANDGLSAYDNQHHDGLDRIVNFGVIDGVVSTGSSADQVTNRGSITGSIDTGAGRDIVNNVRSLDASNVLALGDDDDFAFLGRAEDVVFGGAGFDTASYRFSSGVVVNLANLIENTREAARDSYSEIEQIAGSESHGDVLIGDRRHNVFFGDGGADVLSGNAGRDTLDGGLGRDTMAGGQGNDTFRLDPIRGSGDVITDFSGSLGNDDVFLIAPIGMAGGPIRSANFRARADNQAQDANDFFIFRTTDKTLWFDPDGVDAEAGPILLADLQDTAVVTYQDIVIQAV